MIDEETHRCLRKMLKGKDELAEDEKEMIKDFSKHAETCWV